MIERSTRHSHTSPEVKFMGALNLSRDGLQVRRELSYKQLSHRNIRTFFRTGFGTEFVADSLSHPRTTFQAGIALTFTNTQTIQALKDAGVDMKETDSKFIVSFGEKNWTLCPSAEPRLERAVEERGVIVLTDSQNQPLMVVKFRGKMVGLCLENFLTESGRGFVAGNWYAPVDDRTRTLLKNSFDQGFGRLEQREGRWTLLRALRAGRFLDFETIDDYLEDMRDFVTPIPDFTDEPDITDDFGTTMTRQEYRFQYREPMP